MCDVCGRKAEVEMCALCAIDKFLELSNAIYYLSNLKNRTEEKEMTNIAVCDCGRYWAEDGNWKEPNCRVKLKILQIKLGLVKDVQIHIMSCDICREKGSEK